MESGSHGGEVEEKWAVGQKQTPSAGHPLMPISQMEKLRLKNF